MLTVAPALKPDEAMAMDALYSMALFGAWLRRNPRKPADNADRTDGTRVMKVTSADQLRELLKNGPGHL